MSEAYAPTVVQPQEQELVPELRFARHGGTLTGLSELRARLSTRLLVLTTGVFALTSCANSETGESNWTSLAPPTSTSSLAEATPTTRSLATTASTSSRPVSAPTTVSPTTPSSEALVPAVSESAPEFQPVPRPEAATGFTMVIHSKELGNLAVAVSALQSKPGELFQPPKPQGTTDWMNTTSWDAKSAFPVSPVEPDSLTYVAGHKCRKNTCPFDGVEQKPDGSFNIGVGDVVDVETGTGTLEYTICATGTSPKYDAVGNALPLQIPAGADGACQDDLVFATCLYNDEGKSVQNYVFAATQTGSRAKP
jgi:hypothetical protein